MRRAAILSGTRATKTAEQRRAQPRRWRAPARVHLHPDDLRDLTDQIARPLAAELAAAPLQVLMDGRQVGRAHGICAAAYYRGG